MTEPPVVAAEAVETMVLAGGMEVMVHLHRWYLALLTVLVPAPLEGLVEEDVDPAVGMDLETVMETIEETASLFEKTHTTEAFLIYYTARYLQTRKHQVFSIKKEQKSRMTKLCISYNKILT